jgi:hypothetical protein
VIPIPAIILAIIFVALGLLHFHWALGGRLGFAAAVPTRDGTPIFRPGPGASIAVGVLLLAAALVCLLRGGALTIGPAWVPRLGIWVIAGVMTARAIGDFKYVGFFKRVRGTVFARNDSRFYAPLCAVMAGLAAWLAAGP